MGKDGVMYDAFISYRHSELDSFVAATLHKQLESFKLPRGVLRNKIREMRQPEAGEQQSKELTKEVKTRIHRVFRDKEELPLATNLADPIREALQNSEYLIVICSPRLPESMWCRKEIETFIEMHDREHVLAVLAEGEPAASFPEELLYREAEEKFTVLYGQWIMEENADRKAKYEQALEQMGQDKNLPVYQIYTNNCDHAARKLISSIDPDMQNYIQHTRRITPNGNLKAFGRKAEKWGVMTLGKQSLPEKLLMFLVSF